MLRIGIDIGGTFTDFVIYDPKDDSISTFKLLSDTSNPANTVLQGINQVIGGNGAQIIHGSTVATNALLERKGALTALITTKGFRDILQIGRQNRPNLYDWAEKPAPVLVPPERRYEISERINAHGDIVEQLDVNEVEKFSQLIADSGVESVAVCLIFSFLFPHHEKLIVENLRKKGLFVSASTEILPEYREYERTSTTVVNAYVSPILDHYLSTLQKFMPNSNFQIMQSNGGMISLSEARQNGVRCILSGPSGGIVGAQHIVSTILADKNHTSQEKIVKIITFDMGGTSTDVSLIHGQPTLTTDAIVGGCPIHIPLLDINTIGAGGGSIAFADSGGSLRVGPQSAGSFPGPACYGNSDLPTVTDANLILGRLIPDYFLGGQMEIFPDRAYSAISKLADKLNLSPIQTAYGVIDVVNIQMERALRVISVERGFDPHGFSLFSYGGAGGLHATTLARNLGIARVIIPRYASTLSAFGMLASNVIKDYVQTVMLSGNIPPEQINPYFSIMAEQGVHDLKNEGILDEQINLRYSIDARYAGQSYELNIPFTNTFIPDFHESHRQVYGYSYTNKSIEIVNLRVRAIGYLPQIIVPESNMRNTNQVASPINFIHVQINGADESIPLYDYDHLIPGTHITGPTLIVSTDTTILAHKLDVIHVDKYQNLLIDINTTEKFSD
jgi:N-methylhydantoinase A